MVHTVHASVPRAVFENIAFPRTDNCASVGPSLETSGHSPLTQNRNSVRRNYLISTPGKSESLCMKGQHSVTPVIASKVPDSLPIGLLPESSSTPSARGSDAIKSQSMLRRQPCLRSMAPHLHVPSKASQVHYVQGVTLQSFTKSVMLQAQYSPSGAPKGYAAPTSSQAREQCTIKLQN
jgi:hypothetical protein